MSIPNNLRGRFIEAINRTELDAVMLRDGYIPYLPVIDGGIDVIYFREQDADMRYVQVKGRICIFRKYIDRGIWISFSEDNIWHMYKHDDLVRFCESIGIWVNTQSWNERNTYSSNRVPTLLRGWIQQWQLH